MIRIERELTVDTNLSPDTSYQPMTDVPAISGDVYNKRMSVQTNG